MLASGYSQHADEMQTAAIINCGGLGVQKIYDQFVWSEGGNKNIPEEVLKKIEKYCNPRKNEVAETDKFWSLKYFEPFDAFVTELRTRASSCNFSPLEDRMLRDKIVFTVQGKMKQLLLRDDDLTLEKTIKTCRSFEHANKQMKEMGDNNNSKVNKLKQNKHKVQKERKYDKPAYVAKPKISESRTCKFCGTIHPMVKEQCPAWGKTCDKCHGRNHFKVNVAEG